MNIRDHDYPNIRVWLGVWCGALNGVFSGTIWVFDTELAVSLVKTQASRHLTLWHQNLEF